MANDMVTITNNVTFTPTLVFSGTNFGSLTFTLTGTASVANFQFMSQSAIYEVLSSSSSNFGSAALRKYNFVSTLATSQGASPDNLFMPYNFYC